MFSTSTIVRKIKILNYKGYVLDKLKEELNSGDTSQTEAIFDSYEFNWLQKIHTEKPLDSDEVKTVDLSDISPVKGDEKVKEGKGLKMLTPNKQLTKLQQC